ncbi:MAG: hypothetical protein HAW67_06130 [Endozoicomonadaceae bacterium]|nr:hypothetical protein [Endozoicomonadaceae bacterium]
MSVNSVPLDFETEEDISTLDDLDAVVETLPSLDPLDDLDAVVEEKTDNIIINGAVENSVKYPYLRRASLNKLYYKNRDGSPRDDVGVFEIGKATIHSLNNREGIALDILTENSSEIGSNLSLLLFDDSIVILCDMGTCTLTLNDFASMCSKTK